jgi:drug/metabolite transporter (DMT)-like permease
MRVAMNQLTFAEQITLLASALGLCSGILTGLTNVWLKRWIEKSQMGWASSIGRIGYFALSHVLLLGVSATVLIETSTPPEDLHQLIFFLYIVFMFQTGINPSFYRPPANEAN